MTELSDELLVAYVDGQLAREQTRAVEKVLAQDDVIARRVAALKEAHGRLEAAFEAILASEVIEVSDLSPEPMRAVVELRTSEPRRATSAKAAWASVGIVAALIAAAAAYDWPLTFPELGGWRDLLTPGQAEAPVPSWQADAARAQALLSRASLEVGLESQGNRDLIAFQLAEAIGPEVRLPNLEPQGFRFVRAQLLRNGDQPLVQLLYLPAKRDPLSLYATEGHRDSQPVFKAEAGVGTVYWCVKTASPISWPDARTRRCCTALPRRSGTSPCRLSLNRRCLPRRRQTRLRRLPFRPRPCRPFVADTRRPRAAAVSRSGRAGAIGAQLRATARCGPPARSRPRGSG